MTTRTVRVTRRQGYQISPAGAFYNYPQGDYKVPDEMPPTHAQRAIESGCAIEIRTSKTRPETKTKNAKKPARNKKKRSKAATGKSARS